MKSALFFEFELEGTANIVIFTDFEVSKLRSRRFGPYIENSGGAKSGEKEELRVSAIAASAFLASKNKGLQKTAQKSVPKSCPERR